MPVSKTKINIQYLKKNLIHGFITAVLLKLLRLTDGLSVL